MTPTNRLSKLVKATSKLPKGIRSTLWSKAFGRVVPMVGSANLRYLEVSHAKVVVKIENHFFKRKVDIQALDPQKMTASGKNVIQIIKLKDGLDSDTAKKINKAIKESGIKAQSSIQGDKIRVTDKKRDTLQQTMAFLKEQQFGVPLQFNNFKD